MKKRLLALVMTVAMLVGMTVYLPLGVAAVDAEPATAPETIYSEDFSGLSDGTYTAKELADALGWTLLRGTENAEVATVANGQLTITSEDKTDLVYEIKKDARLKSNFTLNYDLQMVSHTAGNLFFAAIYTGATYNTKAIIPKCTYEGYNHIAATDGKDINEKDLFNFTYTAASESQARPEFVVYGGGTSKSTTYTSWSYRFDFTTQNIDAYASGVRVNSTLGMSDAEFPHSKMGELMGEQMFLRVQKGRVALFDNIEVLTGASVKPAETNVLYSQDFNDIPDGTYTAAEMAKLTGFTYFESNAGVIFSIKNGKLDILNKQSGGMSIAYAWLLVPEMEKSDRVVIEYDMTNLYSGLEGEQNNGDRLIGMRMYGTRSDRVMWFQNGGKGFLQRRVTWESGTLKNFHTGQIRPQNIPYVNRTEKNNHAYDTDTHFCMFNGENHFKLVVDKYTGYELYVNGMLVTNFTAAEVEKWKGVADGIMGHVLNFFLNNGAHMQLDNIKISRGDEGQQPELLVTEISNHNPTKGVFEYVEIYNNSTMPLNIYDYSVVVTAASNAVTPTKNVPDDDKLFIYPGEHTFNSINGGFSKTLTNPAYEEGVIAPGEAVVLWLTSNAMHDGPYGSPAANSWNHTVDDFRTAVGVSEDAKVFMMYNDYNRAFNNSGIYVVGIAEKDVYQNENGTLKTVPQGFSNFISYIIFTFGGSVDTGDNVVMSDSDTSAISGILRPKVTNATGGTIYTAHYTYSNNNTGREGTLMTSTATGQYDFSAGALTDAQKREFTLTANGEKSVIYLGETLNIPVALAGAQAVKAVHNGVTAYGENIIKGIVSDVEATVLDIVTATGAAVRTTGETGMRWITKIDTTDFANLQAQDWVKSVKIGTLIAPTRNVKQAGAFTKEAIDALNLGGDKGDDYNDAVLEAIEWYNTDETDSYYVGAIVGILEDNYLLDFSGVGYIEITLENDETIILYGAYSEEAHSRNMGKVAYDALNDAESGLTDDQKANIKVYADAYAATLPNA